MNISDSRIISIYKNGRGTVAPMNCYCCTVVLNQQNTAVRRKNATRKMCVRCAAVVSQLSKKSQITQPIPTPTIRAATLREVKPTISLADLILDDVVTKDSSAPPAGPIFTSKPTIPVFVQTITVAPTVPTVPTVPIVPPTVRPTIPAPITADPVEEKKDLVDENPYNDDSNPYKEVFNITGLIWVKHNRNATTSGRSVFVMDSECMRTSRFLISHDFQKTQIQTIERCSKVAKIHRDFGLSCYSGDLEDFVSVRQESPCLYFCMDACGTLASIGKCADLAATNNFFDENSILAMTVSARSSGGSFDDNLDTWYQNFKKKCASANLTPYMLQKLHYGGNTYLGRKQSPMRSLFIGFRAK